MIWTDERIAELVDQYIAGGRLAIATEAIGIVRDEYEAHLTEQQQTFYDIMDEVNRVADIRRSRITELTEANRTLTAEANARMAEVKRLEAKVRELSERRYG